MKIDKKLIKELVNNLDEFNLTELEYQDGDKKIKVSIRAKPIRVVLKIFSASSGLRETAKL